MDYQFFQSLSLKDATEYLRRFIDFESRAMEEVTKEAHNAGLKLDYSVRGLPTILKWIMHRIHISRLPVPLSEPEWIRQSHKDGIIEFDEASKILILRAAYYLGECFVRTFPSLRWTTGNPEYMEKNLPAVAGFRAGNEMAPMMVVESLFGRILGDDGPETDIDRAVDTWVENARRSNGLE
jgi:hypothetical protein